MSITLAKTYSKDKAKIWYKIELGRGKGQRISQAFLLIVTLKRRQKKTTIGRQ